MKIRNELQDYLKTPMTFSGLIELLKPLKQDIGPVSIITASPLGPGKLGATLASRLNSLIRFPMISGALPFATSFGQGCWNITAMMMTGQLKDGAEKLGSFLGTVENKP